MSFRVFVELAMLSAFREFLFLQFRSLGSYIRAVCGRNASLKLPFVFLVCFWSFINLLFIIRIIT